MKRLISILITSVLLICCSGDSKKDSIRGNWLSESGFLHSNFNPSYVIIESENIIFKRQLYKIGSFANEKVTCAKGEKYRYLEDDSEPNMINMFHITSGKLYRKWTFKRDGAKLIIGSDLSITELGRQNNVPVECSYNPDGIWNEVNLENGEPLDVYLQFSEGEVFYLYESEEGCYDKGPSYSTFDSQFYRQDPYMVEGWYSNNTFEWSLYVPFNLTICAQGPAALFESSTPRQR